MKSDNLVLRGRVTATTAPKEKLYILPLIRTDQYYWQPHQELEFKNDTARWRSSARFGRAIDKGITGELSLFVLEAAELKKAIKEYQSGSSKSPEGTFDWKEAALRDLEMERCL